MKALPLRLLEWSMISCLCLMGVGELGLRYLAQRGHLPPPVRIQGYPTFNAKYEQMERLESLDCIVIGSSLVWNGLSSQQLQAGYTAASGEALSCYNFGLEALSISAAVPIAEALGHVFQPRLIILAVSLRSFLDYGSDPAYLTQETIPERAWINYQLGGGSWEGWRQEHCRLCSFYVNIPLIWQEGLPSLVLDPQRGYSPRFNYWRSSPRYRLESDRSLAHLLSEKHKASVHHLAAWSHPRTQLLVLEMPVHRNYKEDWAGSVSAYDRRLDELLQPLVVADQPVWRVSELAFLNDFDWRDAIHLYYTGAEKFSYWLGYQLGLQGLEGEPDLTGPTLPEKPLQNFPIQEVPWLPLEGLIFAPSNSPTPRYEQIYTLDRLLSDGWITGDEKTTALEWRSILAQSQLESELNLTPQQQAALSQWRESKRLQDFRQTGLAYLLVHDVWLSFLTPPELAEMAYYEKVAEWKHPAEPLTYQLYRVR